MVDPLVSPTRVAWITMDVASKTIAYVKSVYLRLMLDLMLEHHLKGFASSTKESYCVHDGVEGQTTNLIGSNLWCD